MIVLNYLFESLPGQMPLNIAGMMRAGKSRSALGAAAMGKGTMVPGRVHPILDPLTKIARARMLGAQHLIPSDQK